MPHRRLMAQNPFEPFMLLLCLLSSLPLLAGNAGSKVLESSIPNIAVILWGACLMVGSAMALFGCLVPFNARHPHRRVIAIILERGGLQLVGGAAAIYSGVVLIQAPAVSDVRYAMAIQIAFSGACFLRAFQIGKAIRSAKPPVERRWGPW